MQQPKRATPAPEGGFFVVPGSERPVTPKAPEKALSP